MPFLIHQFVIYQNQLSEHSENRESQRKQSFYIGMKHFFALVKKATFSVFTTTFESLTAKSCLEIQFTTVAPSRLLTNDHYGELLRLGDSRIGAKV